MLIDKETASAELERFALLADLNISTEGLNDDDRSALTAQCDVLVRAIEGGHLTIGDDGEATYTPHRAATKDKSPVTFHEPTGADKMAMDRKKDGHNMAKTYAMMESVTRSTPGRFAAMANADLKVCEALFTLLMVG